MEIYKAMVVIAKMFNKADEDHSLTIEYDEFKNLMAQLKIDRNEEEIKECFETADSDGSGSIDFFEFINFIKSEDIFDNIKELVGETDLAELDIDESTGELEFFLKLMYFLVDYEGKKSITYEQFKICMRNILGLFGINEEIDDSEMREGFDAADTDKSGTLEYKEYCDIVKKLLHSE